MGRADNAPQMSTPVTLGRTDASFPVGQDLLRTLASASSRTGSGTVDAVAVSLGAAADLALVTPVPGSGSTAERWSVMATVAALDITAARVFEPHADALAILAEAQVEPQSLSDIGVTEDSTWGVFAAEGKGLAVQATQTGNGWTLTGTKPWCSLAGRLTHALITAHTAPGQRRLFAVSLRSGSVRCHPDSWIARGLPDVTSAPIDLVDAPAVPIGADNWYLERPGFHWGGIGVAACWWGGAVGLARRLVAQLREEPAVDPLAALQLGAIDLQLNAARNTLEAAASAVDTATADAVLAERTRSQVALAVEEVLHRMDHALGPTPLAFDEWYAAQHAGLSLYVRQHHGEKDLVRLGTLLRDRAVKSGDFPW